MAEPGAGTSDTGLTALVSDAIEGLGLADPLTLAEVALLHRDHARWAVWVPAAGGEWAAVRPAGSRPPGPEVPMLWVCAATAAELGGRMSRADAGLSPSGQD
jgi:hypothetical protein